MKNPFLSALLLSSLLATGCGATTIAQTGVALPHFDADREDETYETSLFYRNDLQIFGGDSDVIYVPEDRDPVYGGYFYQYTSGNFLATSWLEADHSFGCSTLRSRNLNDWEMCGAVDNGYAIKINYGDWVAGYLWAPEVEYDEITERYYLYMSAKTYRYTVPGHSDIDFDRTNFHFLICSSETPVGPFTLLTSEDYYSFKNKTPQYNSDGEVVNLNGEVITNTRPAINVAEYFGLDYPWGAIDVSPFIDGDGTLYLYFSKHWTNEDWDAIKTNNYSYDCLSIWSMRMKDWLTPDYESLRMVAYPSSKCVKYRSGPIYDDSSYDIIPFSEGDEGYGEDDAKLNEGAQVLTHTSSDGIKRYYLTYSQTGFAQRNYGCYQAVSESPMGPFTKIGRNRAAIGVNDSNDYMTGVGHHAYCYAGDELFCIYWVHADPLDPSTSGNNGRVYAFDKTTYIPDKDLGYDIIYTNGPTRSLQPLPAVVSGYRNIASEASISASNCEKDTTKYLNDELITFLDYYDNIEFVSKGKSVITIEFSEPRDIRGLMIFNSRDYLSAFSCVDRINFTLSEKPSWYQSDNYNGVVYVSNLGFNPDYYNAEDKLMRQGGSATCSFNEIRVSKIEINISQTLNGSKEFNISEIYVLGKAVV